MTVMAEQSDEHPLSSGVRVEATAYTVSRLPDTTGDYSVWSVRVEAAGHGRWAVRHMGHCLNKRGEWEYEPLPSSRTDEWLDTVRWDDLHLAVAAAIDAEDRLVINGLTSADVLARAVHSDSVRQS